MKGHQLLAVSAAMSALLILAAARADAEERPGIDSGFRPSIPARPVAPAVPIVPRDFIIVDRYIYDEVRVASDEVTKDKAAPAAPAVAAPAPAAAVAAAPPPPPRKPYAIGNMYSSLPGTCMKLIADGASYYHCDGEWYQLVGSGEYKAVKAP
jgi:hypothetical protein